jgi:hypothetical protein
MKPGTALTTRSQSATSEAIVPSACRSAWRPVTGDCAASFSSASRLTSTDVIFNSGSWAKSLAIALPTIPAPRTIIFIVFSKEAIDVG